MANITLSSRSDIRPLPGATIESFVVSGTVYVGDAIYNNGGSASQVNGGATATAYGCGIVVAAPGGGTAATTGDRVDVVTWGRVTGFASTAEVVAYASNVAGSLDTAAGTVSHKIGIFRDSTTLHVQPVLTKV